VNAELAPLPEISGKQRQEITFEITI